MSITRAVKTSHETIYVTSYEDHNIDRACELAIKQMENKWKVPVPSAPTFAPTYKVLILKMLHRFMSKLV